MTDTSTPAQADPAPSDGGQPGGAQPQNDPGANPTPNPSPAPAAPSGNPGGQPAATPPNQGDDRLKAQVNGMRGFVDPLRQAGYTRPDDVQTLIQKARQLDQLSESGISVEALLGGTRQHQQGQPAQQHGGDSEVVTKSWLTQREDQAAHEQSMGAMRSGLDGVIRELGGEDGGDIVSPYVNAALNDFVQNEAERYPDGHTMAGRVRPLTAAQLETVKARAQERLDKASGYFSRKDVSTPPRASMNPGQTMQGAQGQQPQGGREALRARMGEADRHAMEAGSDLLRGRG
ncbi:MAG: hypothetical protein ACX94C_11725 [Phycisphaerales bacterium]